MDPSTSVVWWRSTTALVWAPLEPAPYICFFKTFGLAHYRIRISPFILFRFQSYNNIFWYIFSAVSLIMSIMRAEQKGCWSQQKDLFSCSSQIFSPVDSGLASDSLTDIWWVLHLSGFGSNMYIYIFKYFSEWLFFIATGSTHEVYGGKAFWNNLHE